MHTTTKRYIGILLLLGHSLVSCVPGGGLSRDEFKQIEENTNEVLLSIVSNQEVPTHNELVVGSNSAELVLTETIALADDNIDKELNTLKLQTVVATPLSIEQQPVNFQSFVGDKQNKGRATDDKCKDERVRTVFHTSQNKQSLNIQSGTYPIEVMVYGGHRVTCIKQDEKWIAQVEENAPKGFSRRLTLPIHTEKETIMEGLSKQTAAWQQNHIHIIFPENDSQRKGYVYIGSRGLKGGMNGGWSFSIGIEFGFGDDLVYIMEEQARMEREHRREEEARCQREREYRQQQKKARRKEEKLRVQEEQKRKEEEPKKRARESLEKSLEDFNLVLNIFKENGYPLDSSLMKSNLDFQKSVTDALKDSRSSLKRLTSLNTGLQSCTIALREFSPKWLEIKEVNEEGYTYLHRAVLCGKLETLKDIIVKFGLDKEATDKDGFTPLHLATGYGYLDIVRYLAEEAGAQVQTYNTLGANPLHTAVGNGRLSVVEYLIEVNKQIDINIQGRTLGNTPLHMAVAYNRLNIVAYLLTKGANKYISNNANGTPFDIAMQKGYREIAVLLDKEEVERREEAQRLQELASIISQEDFLLDMEAQISQEATASVSRENAQNKKTKEEQKIIL
jgi:hypothetical protein